MPRTIAALVIIGTLAIILWCLFAPRIETYATNIAKIGAGAQSKPKIPSVQWKANPAKIWPTIFNALGPPSNFDPTSEGIASWKDTDLTQRGFCWNRVYIHDFDHNYLYVWIKASLSGQRDDPTTIKATNNLNSFDRSIEYDPIYQIIKVSGENLPDIVSMLIVARQILQNGLDLSQARQLLGSIRNDLRTNKITYQDIQFRLCYELQHPQPQPQNPTNSMPTITRSHSQ